jgi:hypothetical protein
MNQPLVARVIKKLIQVCNYQSREGALNHDWQTPVPPSPPVIGQGAAIFPVLQGR